MERMMDTMMHVTVNEGGEDHRDQPGPGGDEEINMHMAMWRNKQLVTLVGCPQMPDPST